MDEKRIYTFAKWQVKEGSLEKVLQLVAEVTEKSLKESGNLAYNVFQSNADPNMVVLFEGYINLAALNEHRDSKHFQNIVVAQIVPELLNREVILTKQLEFH